jgi:hypothetical protein
MASTYSPILRTELIGSGDQAGTWGSTTNSNFQYIFESAIAGYVAVTVSPTSNNQVLTYTNGPSVSAALDQSIYAILKLNAGTLGANFNIFAPPVSKTYVIWNNTGYTATFYNSTIIGNTTAAGAGIAIPSGAKIIIWSDGTNFYGIDSVTGNLTVPGNLTVNGTTTLSGALTYGGVALSNSVTGTGSMVLSASPALTGTPTAPTASLGTNTTQLATTAFVIANAPTPPVIIPAGSVMLFYQAAAPTGWTQVTSLNDYDLRLVSGTGGTTGGTTAYSTVFTNQTPSFTGSNGTLGVNAGSLGTSSTAQGGGVYLSGGGSINGATLSTGQLASHSHGLPINPPGSYQGAVLTYGYDGVGNPFESLSSYGAGSDQSHSHGFNNPSYSFAGDAHSHSITGSPSLSGTVGGSNGAITLNVRYANIIICSKN